MEIVHATAMIINFYIEIILGWTLVPSLIHSRFFFQFPFIMLLRQRELGSVQMVRESLIRLSQHSSVPFVRRYHEIIEFHSTSSDETLYPINPSRCNYSKRKSSEKINYVRAFRKLMLFSFGFIDSASQLKKSLNNAKKMSANCSRCHWNENIE